MLQRYCSLPYSFRLDVPHLRLFSLAPCSDSEHSSSGYPFAAGDAERGNGRRGEGSCCCSCPYLLLSASYSATHHAPSRSQLHRSNHLLQAREGERRV